ncbi:alpha/beta fold hydrolase [Streptomyces sp. NPDC052496]|uniref:esterase/lipase family protein n=1 Tax=Streptomyces sp. NPDC052496 TaxID=3154951 RepID=UPI003427D4F8
MKALPFLCCLARPTALLRATVMELAILVGHLLLYPTGIQQEQHRALPATPNGSETDPDAGPDTGPEAGSGTGPETLGGTPTGDTTTLLPTQGRSHPPVLLLHGFIDNRSVFVLLRRSLLRHGWRHVEALNYSPLTCDLRKAAELLGHHVEQICRRTGHSRVDLVGHSLGGLIARYYAQRLGGDLRVRTLVTLGTPHGGTRVAPLMSAHPLVRQMRPHSDVIVELARPAPNCRTHFVCFWSDLDQLMVPVETARIDHRDLITRSVRVSGVGHLALPVNGAVAAGIREALGAEEETLDSATATSVA